MPLFKLWNVGRSVRKIVMADSLTEVLAKGKEKMGIPADVQARLVLNQDGTDIDEGDLLEHFKNDIFLILTPEEFFTEQAIMQITMAQPPASSVDVETCQQDQPATTHTSINLVETPTAVNKQDQPATSSFKTSGETSADMPHPNKLDLPQFSPNTILLLEQKHEGAVKAVLTEASVYYYTKYPKMSSTDYYQAIGQQLVRKYPFLEHTDGKNRWSYISTKLSSRIRQLRMKYNKKTATGNTRSESEIPPKKFRFESVAKDQVLEHDILEQKLQDMIEEWNGNRETAQINILMVVTRPNRRLMIQKGMTVPQIMTTFPPFEDGNHVMNEFCSLLGNENFTKAKEVIAEKKRLLFRKVAGISKESDDDSVALVRYLEEKVAIVQGKGTKSKRVLTLLEVDSVDIPDDQLRKKLKTKIDAPMSITLLMVDKKPRLAYLVGGSHYINCNTADVTEAVLLLLGSYYAFHLNYPAIYGQLLGFLQQYILEQPYPFFKGTNFQRFSHKVCQHAEQ